MTLRKHFKDLVRERMTKTGESYTAARRQLLREPVRSAGSETDGRPGAPPFDTSSFPPSTRAHLPGSVPAATALRVLLAHAGIDAASDRGPISEALAFGIAGGIGIGVFSFYYEKEDVATFFLAGRHLWHDDLAYLRGAIERFGLEPVIAESSGAKTAEKQLRAALDSSGVSIAWVDAALLPHRAMPARYQGGAYHVVTVYGIDDAKGTAWIGDTADAPIEIALRDFAASRARIAKQKNRILSIAPRRPDDARRPVSLDRLVREGIETSRESLLDPSMKSHAANFRLDALRTWADRLHGSSGKESWERQFRPGANLWRGLSWLYDTIEHHGTGGGLCRPLFADFLEDAGVRVALPALAALAERYRALGKAWRDLAHAALPDDVELLRRTREALARKAEGSHSGASVELLHGAWNELEEIEREAAAAFPLSSIESADLRSGLAERVRSIAGEESALLDALAPFSVSARWSTCPLPQIIASRRSTPSSCVRGSSRSLRFRSPFAWQGPSSPSSSDISSSRSRSL
jgi:hypothetical protein